MARLHRALLLSSLLLGPASAESIVYVTDLSIFTYLAPCAASAISYNVLSQTYSACPEATDALQSCVCSKDGIFANIVSSVSSSVKSRCGSTATDDQASASTVLSAYCNQGALPVFPKPSILVSQYITDVPEFTYLAKCAGSQLSYAVMGLTDTQCPPEATALASCACQKQQNSLVVSQSINLSVKSACESHTADVSSAQAFFAAYCAMNSGTTAFPSASNPPGDMSYYITDLPQFTSLAPCARSGLSYGVFANTYSLCPEGPQALASCACLKEGMSVYASSEITSSVRYYCSSNVADVTSALAVWSLYCSAARSETLPAGVTNSIPQPSAIGGGGGGGGRTNSNGGPQSTGVKGGQGGSGNSTTDATSTGRTVVIAGAAVGVVVGLSLIGIVVFFVMRNARRKRNAGPAPIVPLNNDTAGGFNGKAELAGIPLTAAAVPPPSPSPSTMKLNGHSPITHSVSPVSAHSSAYPPPGTPELHGHPPVPQFSGHFPPPDRPELQGQMYKPNGALHAHHAELPSQYGHANAPPNRPELYGQAYSTPMAAPTPPYGGQRVHEFPGHHAVYQADSRPVPQRAELQGMGWQSGPVQHSYAELDGGYARGPEPHAR